MKLKSIFKRDKAGSQARLDSSSESSCSAHARPTDLQDALPTARKFAYFGVNLSGPEFGEKNYTGVKGKEYQWPTLSTTDTFVGKGMNTFRISILAERIIVGKDPRGPVAEEYMKDLKTTVDYITSKGAYAMINPHNYGRWYGNINTDPAGFEAYWKTLATPFKDNQKVIFDTDNEFHDMPQDLVIKLNQAAINGIRASGATSQVITVEGNSWTGAWHWVKGSENHATMHKLTDPSDKLIFQMHQYLDTDGSGTHEACVSKTIGVERLQDATRWLREHKKTGLIGEYAGGDNAVCQEAVRAMLAYMADNRDVWAGHLWWAAGPWWDKYMYSLEPPSGRAVAPYLDLIAEYA